MFSQLNLEFGPLVCYRTCSEMRSNSDYMVVKIIMHGQPWVLGIFGVIVVSDNACLCGLIFNTCQIISDYISDITS